MKGGDVKTFFDGIFMNKEHLEEEGIEYPIKLEYFKTSIEEENVETKYGIEIVKTEYLEGNVKVETKELINVTNDILEQERILKILIKNEVTPVGLEDVIAELV